MKADSLEQLGRDAAQEAWAEHGGDLVAIPNRPGLRAWARVAFTLGLVESEWHLTEPERRTFVHAYRNELQALSAAESQAAARGKSPVLHFSACSAVIRDLRRGADQLGAGEAELAAIDRLENERAEVVDVERLAPLADAVGLPWQELFPELSRRAP